MGRLLFFAVLGLVVMVAADGCSGAPCVDRSECSASEVCAYEVGSCSAQGHCMSRMADSYVIVEYCGCDGSIVSGGAGAGFPGDYVSGPTLGPDVPLSKCETPSPEPDAGSGFTLPPFDAGNGQGSPDALTMPDVREGGEGAVGDAAADEAGDARSGAEGSTEAGDASRD